MNNSIQLKILHVFTTYGEMLAIRESVKTFTYLAEKENFAAILIKKQKYLKLIKHKFKEDHPKENDEMLNLLTLYQEERESAKNELNRATEDVKGFVRTIENAVLKFDPKNNIDEAISGRAFAQVIEFAASKDLLDGLFSISTKDMSETNLKSLCEAMRNAIATVTEECMRKVESDHSHGKTKVEIFKKVSEKVLRAISGVELNMELLGNIGTMCPNPVFKYVNEEKNIPCLECKGQGYVDEIVDHDHNCDSVWARRPCDTCTYKGLISGGESYII